MANSYGWPDPKVTYNKNAKKIADARAARAAQVAQLHYPMPMAPVSSSMPPMGQPPMGMQFPGQGAVQPQTMAPPALPTGQPWPPVPSFRAGGIVRFDDGGDVELTDEEKQRQAIANAGNIPVPAPALPPGGALAGSVGDTLGQAPVYGPPAPTYLQAAQQVYAQNPELVSIAAGELQQNNGIANIQQYQQQLAQQQAQQQQYEARQAGTTQVNPNQGGARGPENPPNVQPGPNADMGILDVGKIQQQYEKVNPSIPYVTPAIENYVKPAVGAVINNSGLGVGLNALTGEHTNYGQGAANMTIPSHALDLALTAAPFAGEAASAGRGALENAAVKGLEFKPQGLEALGGREAAATQLKGGLPAGAALTPQEGAQLRAQAEAAGLTAADWQHSSVLQDQYGRMGADGAVARAKQALEQIGERTVGSPSEVLKRYDNAGAQIFPELGEAQHRVNNMAGNAYQDTIAKGGSLEDAKAAAAKAAATQQEVEKNAIPRAPIEAQNQAGGYVDTLQQALDAKGVTSPAEVASPIQPDITREAMPGDRHVLSMPDGSRSEWRGYPNGDAHLLDTTVMQERQGTGTILRENALTDIYTQNPAARVTADFNSEGGVRLFDRGAEPGQAHYYDRPGGTEISKEEAIARTQSGQGAVGEMAPPSPDRLQQLGISPEITMNPEQAATARTGEDTARQNYLSQTQQDFLNSPGGRAAATQRDAAINAGIRPGEATSVTTGAPATTATGGVGQPPIGTGGTGIPPTGGAGATPLKPQNPIQQAINVISMPTQTRLLGGHFLRQGEGAAVTHPKEAIDAFRAGFREFTKPGQANKIVADIRARGSALPEGGRLQDVRGVAGQRLEKGIGDKLLGQIPLFDRLRGFGTTYLNTLRDGIYVTTAERHYRMDPEAPPEALKAVYNTLSHETGHPTLKGNVKEAMGNVQGLGVGWGALQARAQHFGDILLAPGSPLPWSPTAKGEAVRGLLGNVGTMIASTTAASYLGAKVDVPFLGGNRDLTNPYGIKTDFFKPVTTTPDLAYKTVYGTGGSGYDSIIRLFGNAAIDLASQNFTGKNSLESHILNWARGEAGVAPSVLIDLISGSTYNGKPYDLDKLKEEAAHGFWERVAPIAAESMIKAYGAWGPEGLARAAPSLGAWEVQTTPTTKTNQGNALLDSDQRDQLLGPTLAPLVKPGEDFNALGSREKEAIHAGMNPDALKAERDQKIKDGDPVAIAQFQREDIKNSYQPAFQKLDEALHNGTYTPYEARQLVNATERQMYEKMNAVKFPEGNKDYTPSPIQKAEEGYRSIYDALPKGTNGKPDYDQLQKAQQSYMANIGRSDPELMQRLAANVLPRVNPNDSNIQKMYDQPEMKQAVQAYNQQDDGAKTGWRIENPSQNALLYSGGYVRTLDTPAALTAFKAMGIAGEPEVNFAVGFTKETATPYSRIQAGSLQPQLQAYQGLNASREEGDFRAQAYLKEHPALNALLWQTGHTSHVYSVPAYESITGHHEAPLASNSPLRSEVPAPAAVGAPMAQSSMLGPNGRSAAEIAGKPYQSEEERNWYFQSRGLPIPEKVVGATAGSGSAYQTNQQGRTGQVNAIDMAPVADKFGISAGPFALLMNHEGNGAHDNSETGVQPARWGITQTTARSNGIQDTRQMTPEQAYNIAGNYIQTGLKQFNGDEAKAYASYYIGAGGVQKAVEQGGDWVKNADRIAAGVGNKENGLDYGNHSMTDFLQYLGLR